MNKRNFGQGVCKECASPFLKYRSNHIFCSEECRSSHRGKERWERDQEKLKEAHRRWREGNFEKRRSYMLKYTFGISAEEYEELLEKQNYSCYICERPETVFAKKLAVDHDHITGEIRGLLCHSCNKLVIGKQRDPNIFLKAAEYLKGPFTGWFVPNKKPRRKRKKKNG